MPERREWIPYTVLVKLSNSYHSLIAILMVIWVKYVSKCIKQVNFLFYLI